MGIQHRLQLHLLEECFVVAALLLLCLPNLYLRACYTLGLPDFTLRFTLLIDGGGEGVLPYQPILSARNPVSTIVPLVGRDGLPRYL